MLDIQICATENPDLVDKVLRVRQNAHWDREKFFELDEGAKRNCRVESLQAGANVS